MFTNRQERKTAQQAVIRSSVARRITRLKSRARNPRQAVLVKNRQTKNSRKKVTSKPNIQACHRGKLNNVEIFSLKSFYNMYT